MQNSFKIQSSEQIYKEEDGSIIATKEERIKLETEL